MALLLLVHSLNWPGAGGVRLNPTGCGRRGPWHQLRAPCLSVDTVPTVYLRPPSPALLGPGSCSLPWGLCLSRLARPWGPPLLSSGEQRNLQDGAEPVDRQRRPPASCRSLHRRRPRSVGPPRGPQKVREGPLSPPFPTQLRGRPRLSAPPGETEPLCPPRTMAAAGHGLCRLWRPHTGLRRPRGSSSSAFPRLPVDSGLYTELRAGPCPQPPALAFL